MTTRSPAFGVRFLTELKSELAKSGEPTFFNYAKVQVIKGMERAELIGFLHGRFFLSPSQLARMKDLESPIELAHLFASPEMHRWRKKLHNRRYFELMRP